MFVFSFYIGALLSVSVSGTFFCLNQCSTTTIIDQSVCGVSYLQSTITTFTNQCYLDNYNCNHPFNSKNLIYK